IHICCGLVATTEGLPKFGSILRARQNRRNRRVKNFLVVMQSQNLRHKTAGRVFLLVVHQVPRPRCMPPQACCNQQTQRSTEQKPTLAFKAGFADQLFQCAIRHD
ncbi:MAG: hypothetical protein ACK55I_49185, partial [bacterium]